MNPLPILTKDPRPCLFSPCGWLLTPWVDWNDFRKSPLTLPYLQSTATLDSCHSKDHHSLIPPNTYPPLIPELKMPHLVTTSQFSLSQVHQIILVSIPISSWISYLSHLKISAILSLCFKNALKQSDVISYLFSSNFVCHTTESPTYSCCECQTHLWPTESPNWFKIL